MAGPEANRLEAQSRANAPAISISRSRYCYFSTDTSTYWIVAPVKAP
jgi:hypothetical protein